MQEPESDTFLHSEIGEEKRLLGADKKTNSLKIMQEPEDEFYLCSNT